MDDTGDVTQDGQQDVDEEVGIATALKEDTERGQDDGEDDLDDVAAVMSVSSALRHGAGGGGSAYLPVKGMMAVWSWRLGNVVSEVQLCRAK